MLLLFYLSSELFSFLNTYYQSFETCQIYTFFMEFLVIIFHIFDRINYFIDFLIAFLAFEHFYLNWNMFFE